MGTSLIATLKTSCACNHINWLGGYSYTKHNTHTFDLLVQGSNRGWNLTFLHPLMWALDANHLVLPNQFYLKTEGNAAKMYSDFVYAIKVQYLWWIHCLFHFLWILFLFFIWSFQFLFDFMDEGVSDLLLELYKMCIEHMYNIFHVIDVCLPVIMYLSIFSNIFGKHIFPIGCTYVFLWVKLIQTGEARVRDKTKEAISSPKIWSPTKKLQTGVSWSSSIRFQQMTIFQKVCKKIILIFKIADLTTPRSIHRNFKIANKQREESQNFELRFPIKFF